ncbi:four-helix bundle copper-binding protein [Inquilinus sp. KBS0705]|nr:four-helix bundle copper-binding protein [Inquilinus sp. KBS0705]
MENHDHTALIEKLLACVAACQNCATACLHEENVKPMVRCISLDRDCADICALTTTLLQRESEIAHQFLVLCEEICIMCAKECSMHEHQHCQICAQACRECAEACHKHHQPILQD